MSTILEQIKAQAELAAQTGPDMTEVQVGGSARVLPLGMAQARLVGYIELGMQAQEYQGKAKQPAMEFQLMFALTGAAPDPDNPGKTLPYTNDDGSPYIFTTFPTSMSRNEKAQAFLVFKAMNYKGTAKHFGQLIGDAFLLPIVDMKNEKTGKVRRTPDLKNIKPPYYPDPMTGQVINVPVAPPRDEDLKFFSWEHPTLEGFNALKVEGEWENKDEKTGVITKESKNRIQEKMLGATDFIGSPLELLLKQNNVAYVIPAKKAAATAPAVPTAAVPNVQAATPVVAAAPAIAVPAGVAVVTPQPAQTIAPAAIAPVAVIPASVAVATPAAAPAVALPGGVALPVQQAA